MRQFGQWVPFWVACISYKMHIIIMTISELSSNNIIIINIMCACPNTTTTIRAKCDCGNRLLWHFSARFLAFFVIIILGICINISMCLA